MIAGHDRDARHLISTAAPTRTEWQLAVTGMAISAVIFAIAIPFARAPVPHVPAFVAAYQSALAVNDLVTAVLIFLQFKLAQSRALLAVASAYLFTAILATLHQLTFPGLYADDGLLGAGPQSTVWLYLLWHGTFPLLLIGYALAKGRPGDRANPRSSSAAIAIAILVTTIAAAIVGLATTAGHDSLPVLLSDGEYTTTMNIVVTSVWSISTVALLVMWRRKPHSVLDVWLMVVLFAWICDVGLSAAFNHARFDLGFYLGRIYGLAAASIVLVALLFETGALQAQLMRLIESTRRQAASERARFADQESLFAATVESSIDAIIVQSLDGTILAWNAAAEQLFGYSAEEAIGQNTDVIVPDDRRIEVRQILDQVAQGSRIKHHETVRRRKDGTQVPVSLSVSPIRSASGAVIGASKIARDITETQRTQYALSREIDERQRLFETSLDLILVTDPVGTFVQVSPSVISILGYRPDEMVGQSAQEFIYFDDLESTRDEMRSARRGGEIRNFVSRYIHKDGRVVVLIWMGTWSETARRYYFIGRDMTEMRRAQDALVESEQMARGIIETALDAFIQMDQAGIVRDWNSQAESIFGWSRAEAVGRPLAALIIPEQHRASHASGVRRFLETGDGPLLDNRIEIEAQRRDGSKLTVELSITAFRRRDDTVFNGFLRDMTEKIARESQYRQAQKMEAIGQLTGGVAHDFNNILTVITGTIEILAEGVADQPELAAITKMIDEAAQRGADLTKHLLAFARRQPLEPRELDVNALVTAAGKLLRPTLGEQIEIHTKLTAAPWVAFVDPNQLTTAILNLALNARDAMQGGGKLTIETENVELDEGYAGLHSDVKAGPYVLVAISDTGSGIPANLLDKVFEPFFTTKEPGKGTGLGLSMVYGFVKQSGGHIKIYSEQGVGTTVRLYLPRSVEKTIAATEPAPRERLPRGSEVVLIVEDDELVRNYVVAQVRSLGYATLAAAGAAAALEILRSDAEIDLLFTDVIMPGSMNGPRLVAEALKLRPQLGVLYTSGYTENAIVHHGRLDPGVLLLAKPYRKADLARMLRQALQAVPASAAE
jgi:PAS domain S-box-containing protein